MRLLIDTERSKRWQALAATGCLPPSSKKRKTRLRQLKATLARQRKRAKQVVREHDSQRLRQSQMIIWNIPRGDVGDRDGLLESITDARGELLEDETGGLQLVCRRGLLKLFQSYWREHYFYPTAPPPRQNISKPKRSLLSRTHTNAFGGVARTSPGNLLGAS